MVCRVKLLQRYRNWISWLHDWDRTLSCRHPPHGRNEAIVQHGRTHSQFQCTKFHLHCQIHQGIHEYVRSVTLSSIFMKICWNETLLSDNGQKSFISTGRGWFSVQTVVNTPLRSFRRSRSCDLMFVSLYKSNTISMRVHVAERDQKVDLKFFVSS